MLLVPISKRRGHGVKLKTLVTRSVVKFLTVGSVAFAIEYTSFYVFYSRFEWRLYIANSASFMFGLLTSFTLNRLWTFRHPAEYSKNVAHQLSYYTLLAFINFLLTNLIVEVLVGLTINPQVSKLIAMVTTSLWNFTLFKLIIFTHKEHSEGE